MSSITQLPILIYISIFGTLAIFLTIIPIINFKKFPRYFSIGLFFIDLGAILGILLKIIKTYSFLTNYSNLILIIMLCISGIGFAIIVIGGIYTVNITDPYRKSLFKTLKIVLIPLTICVLLILIMLLCENVPYLREHIVEPLKNPRK